MTTTVKATCANGVLMPLEPLERSGDGGDGLRSATRRRQMENTSPWCGCLTGW